MTKLQMSTNQRIAVTLKNQEPDRVPLFLPVTMHGAKELGTSIKEYFAKAENVVEGQLRMQKKYQSDFLFAFFYAALELEAWGGEVIYAADGPPNAGAPIIKKIADISKLTPPKAKECSCLAKVLQAQERLKAKAMGTPIIGVVLSPASLAVLQLGFERFFTVMYEYPDLLARLLQINQEFCLDWAHAQLQAGADIICYFDPIASGDIVPKEGYLYWQFGATQEIIKKLTGPVVLHLASGRCLSILEQLKKTGAAVLGTSVLEDIGQMKQAAGGQIAIMGNLNGIDMCNWSPAQAEAQVRRAIAKGGVGGGFILSDSHGEIPWQVPEAVLLAITEAVQKWGTYPLGWVKEDER